MSRHSRLQCFATDYAWYETRREALAAGYMIAEIRRGLEAIGSGNEEYAWDLEMWNRLAVVATYRPIYRIEGIEKLLTLGLPTESPYRRMLIQQQLIEPVREQEITTEISGVTGPSTDSEPDTIERSPYPRWHRLPSVEPRNLADGLEELIPGLTAPEYTRGPVRLLCAGCATGQKVLGLAAAYENVDIMATDPSLVNLAYAARMAQRMDVANIEFRQSGRDELDQLDGQYQLVDTGETLIWTEDALTPWQALVDRLMPSGLMHFQVRADTHREGLVMAREFVKQEGLTGDSEGVRKARRAIIELPEGELARRVVAADGFYNFYQCRDILFSDYDEARFDIGRVRELMAEMNLEFLAYEVQKPSTMAGFLEEFGDAADPFDLDQWAVLEARQPLALTTTHRIWCQKSA